jgi:hypothetical protein
MIYLIIGVSLYLLIGLFLATFFFMLAASVQKEDGNFLLVVLFAGPLVLMGVIK